MLPSGLTVAVTLKAFDEMSKVVQAATSGAARQFRQFQERVSAASTAMRSFGAGSLAVGAAAGATLAAPIRAFMTLEDAQTQLKSTLMQSNGQISTMFAAIDKQALALGNRLPGTTADFYAMASSLKSLGVTEKSIAGGVLAASANLGVVLKPLGVTFQDSAVAMAKFKEALGIADGDMIKFADTIQRTAHLGVQLGEMRFAFSKVAPTLQTLRIQGLGAANDLAPLVGMMIKTGKSGEEAGSGLADVIKATLDLKKIGAANKELAKYGVSLDFVDKKTGQFKGVTNMIAQFDKLQKLTPVMRSGLLSGLFGTGGAGDVASIMATQGVAGYQKMTAAMKQQADLNQRVALALGTLGNVWESLLGTAENALAVFGGALAPELKALANYFNGVSESIGNWAKAHPALTRQIMLGVAAFAAVATVVGGAALAIGTIGAGVAFVSGGLTSIAGAATTAAPVVARVGQGIVTLGARFAGLRFPTGVFAAAAGWPARIGLAFASLRVQLALGLALIPRWVGAQLAAARTSLLTAGGLRAMGGALVGRVVGGLRAAAVAARLFATTMLFTPQGLAIAALATAAVLVYKYWKPISGFFRGLWRGFVEGLGPVSKAVGPAFAKMAAAVAPVLGPLRAVGRWLAALLKPVDDVGGGAEKMGRRFGLVIAGMVNAIGGLANKMAIGAANMMSSLANGISAGAAKVYAQMQKVAAGVRAYWPFSPAKAGPLRDIHRIKLVETIAASVRPAPLVKVMTQVAGAARAAALPAVRSVLPPVSAVPAVRGALSPAVAGAAARGGGVSIHFAPTVDARGAAPGVEADIKAQLAGMKHELVKMVKDATASRDRSKFGG